MSKLTGNLQRATLISAGILAACTMQQAVWADSGTTAAAAQAAPAAAPAKPLDKAEAEGIIFERQQIMLQIEKDADTLGKIVSGEISKDSLAATTRALADGAKDAQISFKQTVPGGRSKPEVWTNADYQERMQRFADKTEQMAKMGEAKNVNGVIEIMIDALPCKECHDLYRVPKQKT